jgi:hypothetical protein
VAPRASEPRARGSVGGARARDAVALRVLRSGEQGWRDPTLLVTARRELPRAMPLGGASARLVAGRSRGSRAAAARTARCRGA